MFTYRLQRDNLGRPVLRNTAVCHTYTCKIMKTKSAICYRHKRKDETGESIVSTHDKNAESSKSPERLATS